MVRPWDWPSVHVWYGRCRDRRLGNHRADVRFQRHVAVGHQHGTTIVTFLMVFLIQNTQNRDTGAMQAKLDELIRAIEGATTRCSIWKSSTKRRSSTSGATIASWPQRPAKRSRKEETTRIATRCDSERRSKIEAMHSGFQRRRRSAPSRRRLAADRRAAFSRLLDQARDRVELARRQQVARRSHEPPQATTDAQLANSSAAAPA